MSKVMDTQNCFHCGLDIIKEDEIILILKISVVTVVKRSTNFQSEWFDVLLWFWKSLEQPRKIVLVNMIFYESIVSKLLEFQENSTAIIS
jgi:Cu+-exporting ATPase